jgi:hypothetical protein
VGSSCHEEAIQCYASSSIAAEQLPSSQHMTATNTLSLLPQSYAMNADPELKTITPQWKDALSRSTLTSSLILDEKPGFLSQMVE